MVDIFSSIFLDFGGKVILGIEKLISKRIDRFSLMIGDIIVLKNMFS